MAEIAKFCVVPWCEDEAVVQVFVDGTDFGDDGSQTTRDLFVWFCREHGPKVGGDV